MTASRGLIIAGLDDRQASKDALALAADLCEQGGFGLVAARILPTEGAFAPYDQPHQQNVREMVAKLREEIEDSLARVPDGKRSEVRTFSATSPPAGLHDLADAEPAWLIVLGSSHRGPVGRVLVGSTATRLLVDAPCPIAVAPAGYAEAGARPINKVGVALDGCPSCEGALARARDFAVDLGAELVALAVPPRKTSPEEMEDRVGAMFAGLEAPSPECHCMILDGSPVSALAGASEQVDLLVTGCRETGGVVGHPTLGSTSRRLIRTAGVPVVVVPESLRT